MLNPTRIPAPPNEALEVQARRRLRFNRMLATALLVLMLGTAIATHLVQEPGFGLLLLRAAAEAGTVGGLADWFAVSALFHHPLGIPIPHTAILPRNKERLGRALGHFIERNFLTREALLSRLRTARAGERLAAWLSEERTAALISGAVVAAVPTIVHAFENRDIRSFLNRTLGEHLRQADVAPLIGRILHLLTQSPEADVVFERAVAIAITWLAANEQRIGKMVESRSRWWIPSAIDRKIADAIFASVMELLQELKRPEGEARQHFRASLVAMAEQLQHSADQREKVNASKNRLLEHSEVGDWLESIWSELAHLALADADASPSAIATVVANATRAIGRALSCDAAMQGVVDSTLQQLAERLISWRSEIGDFVAEVVGNWDTRTVTERLELAVGSDLQYIRMNGTLVGALAGLVLFLLTRLVG